ncbi:uncharacterized protein V1518DRAFT_416751 [Limtongia smithiae]|uniref:uncharacterized protein n=1 Tax=Limtongia smithiae TaxID=1125753 RepID=UPI0034CD9AFF
MSFRAASSVMLRHRAAMIRSGAMMATAATLYAGYATKTNAIVTNDSVVQEKTGAQTRATATATATAFPRYLTWVNVKLEDVRQISHDVKMFRFALPADIATTGIAPGQAILTKTISSESSKSTFRPYTPLRANTEGYIEFAIKHYPGGRGSTNFHALKIGDEVAMKGPLPGAPVGLEKVEHLVLLGGGAGITPLHSVIYDALENPKSASQHVTLVYSNKTEDDILFKSEFTALQRQYPDRFRVVYTLTRTPPTSWTGFRGHIDEVMLKSVLTPAESTKVLVCGPPGFVMGLAGHKRGPFQGKLGGLLRQMGFQESDVHKL